MYHYSSSKTLTADELNQQIREDRERLTAGPVGSARLPQPSGNVPALSPATPGATYALRNQGKNHASGLIDS